MSEQFYSDARLYDRLFPRGEQAVDFYRAEADRQGGCVLELACGTGHKLIPVAAGNMTEWLGLPADVGVLTLPEARGRGLAKRVAATMVAQMLPTIGVARYRGLATNAPSLAVAMALGFQPYGQSYRARRVEQR